MLKEATCFVYNRVPHTILCCDPINKKYWCLYVDFYGLQYYWLDINVVDNIVNGEV